MMSPMMSGALSGPDALLRCPWALSAPEYLAYHDDEWGRPVSTVQGLYERMTLEAFQSGLSWITILRKRENFRQAFAGFSPEQVAGFTDDDIHRLLSDPRLADRPISTIAFDVGFGTLSHFNHSFRRRFGLSPSDVRAQARRET